MLHISDVNGLSHEDFILRFGNVVERCALCASCVWAERPFRDIFHLYQCIREFLDDLSSADKMGVLRLYHGLVASREVQERLSQESIHERTTAGLSDIEEDELELVAKLLKQYSEQFPFPFVLCLLHTNVPAIITGIETRLKNPVEQEILAGMAEIKKICWFRLKNIVFTEETASHL